METASPFMDGTKDTHNKEFLGNVSVVNLGCAKNQVDAEVMLGALRSAGFSIVDDPNEADVAVVNTCGFLQPAVEEGIDAILDLSELKANRLRKLIVVGCMVERYGEDLKESLPEVDHFLGGNDLLRVIESAQYGYDSPLREGARPYFLYDDTLPRFLETEATSAYVKIAEGCNRPCSFCIIPKIRGTFRSREPHSIVSEINDLAARGVREVNLVAQDLTAYGSDLKKPAPELGGSAPASMSNLAIDFVSLLRLLDQKAQIPWIRLYYAYPLGISEELMRTIVQSERIVNYLDIPLQHASESVLKRMKRPLGKFSPRPLAQMMRAVSPEVALRTTFIVGHPGETEKDVEDLADFLREIRFQHVGIFTYSREEGTPSAELDGQIEDSEKQARRDYLMEVQQEIQTEGLQRYVGKAEEVLLEGIHQESDLLLRARTHWQGPDVDGEVIINDIDEGIPAEDCHNGRFGTVEITEVAGYDLVGRLISLS
jgi:ribosomal protein S12 methylthiotransferase